jgi:prefoldin subunit 2
MQTQLISWLRGLEPQKTIGTAALNAIFEVLGKYKKMAEGKAPSEKELVRFQQLRQEQRGLAVKLSELESDRNEHKLVVDALKDMDPSRKCFRMVGGVLVERTVGEVLPALKMNVDKMEEVIANLNGQIKEKGKELLELKEKHNIKFQGERVEGVESDTKRTSQGVLVGK